MPNLQLVEYPKNLGSHVDYLTPANTFTFDPQPRSIKKNVSVKWRIRRPGYMKKIERARFRYNEKISFTITGSCSKTKRDEIEFYAKRDSLFELVNCNMKTYHSQETEDEQGATPQDFDSASTETVYVVFESANFTEKEARPTFFDYTIKLRRVHQKNH